MRQYIVEVYKEGYAKLVLVIFLMKTTKRRLKKYLQLPGKILSCNQLCVVPHGDCQSEFYTTYFIEC